MKFISAVFVILLKKVQILYFLKKNVGRQILNCLGAAIFSLTGHWLYAIYYNVCSISASPIGHVV